MSHYTPLSSDESSEKSYPTTTWYTSNSVVPPEPLYNNPYATPSYSSSSTFEMNDFQNITSQWPTTQGFYNTHIPPTTMPGDMIKNPQNNPNTSRSSVNEMSYPVDALGIHIPGPESTQVLGSNIFPALKYQYTSPQDFSTPSPPQHSNSDIQRVYQPLAPNPSGLAAKRRQEREEEEASFASVSKRRKRTPSIEITDEQACFLLELKEKKLPWKVIAAEMSAKFNETFKIAQLQMRWKRLPEGLRRVWKDRDIEALKQAHEFWEESKWEFISKKMIEFGAEEPWSEMHCSRKWAELSNQQSTQRSQTPQHQQQQQQQQRRQSTPTPHYTISAENLAQYATPAETLEQFRYM